MTAIRDAGGGDLEVVTPDATYRTRAGRPDRRRLDERVARARSAAASRSPITKEQVTYFACPDPAAFAPDRFPVWIWMDDPCFYGFPTYGEAGPKAAQDCGGSPVDPDERTFDRDETAFARLGEFMATHLPGAVGPPIYTKTCLYTLTPDRDFVVDRLPDLPGRRGRRSAPRTASSSPRCSVACWPSCASTGSTPSAAEIARFRIDRPILLEDDPADLVDGLSAIRAHGAGHGLRWTRRCATVPPIRARRAPMRRRRRMRVSLRGRMARVAAVLGLTAALVLPAGLPATAADPAVLKIGTTQDLDSLNPYQTALLVGYEIFTLNYDMLVGFGPNNESVPGYAESWSQSSDGLTWTFKIRDGMKWSDGQPATAEDAAWTLQYYLDAQKTEVSLGYGYLDPYVTNAAITAVKATDPTTLTVTTSRKNDRILQMYLPILPEHVWKDVPIDKVGDFANNAAGRRDRSLPGRRVEERPVGTARPQQSCTGAPRAPPTRSSSSSSPTRRTRWSTPSRTASSTTSGTRPGSSSTSSRPSPAWSRSTRPATASPRSTSTATTRTSPTAAPRPRRSATRPSAPRSATRSIARP